MNSTGKAIPAGTPGVAAIDVSQVAALARLQLAEEELADLQQDMQRIVGYVAQLGELDLTGIEPMAHAAGLRNVWREDVAGDSFPRAAMLANAPATLREELVKVPPVLPGEDEG